MRFVLLLMTIVLFLGCETFEEPDFNKPLIPIPENKETKPQPEKIWVEAKTSRIWVNPHVDENGDLVEGHYKDTVLEPGHWVVHGNQTSQP